MKKFKKIYIEITNACNLDCSFCHNNKREKRFMSVSDFSHIIDEIKDYTDYVYLHVKGEPLLNPNLDIFLDICDKNNLFVNITTNGTLLNKNKDLLYRHECVRQINVSLHSENDDDDDYLDNVFSVCDYLSNNIYICYRIWTLTAGTFDEKSTEIVDKMIEHYKISPFVVEKIYNDKQITLSKNIFFSKDDLFTWPSIVDSYSSDGYCHGTINHLGILVDGEVVPCCLDGEGIVNLGNVLSTSFEKIVNSEKLLKIKNGFKNNICFEELCKKCRFKDRFN